MPVYEYGCPSCKARFSVHNVPMSESDNNKPCPDCASTSPRVMSCFDYRIAAPFRIMQEEKDSPGHYIERAFAPDCDTPPPGTSREYWDEVDRDGDAEAGENIEKEAAEIAIGNREPIPARRPPPRMFPNGAPLKGLDNILPNLKR